MSTEDTLDTIIEKMEAELEASSVEVEDESWKHAGHASAGGGGHFILYVTSARFEGVSLMNRNRMVFDILKEEMKGEIHALTVRAKTPTE